MLAPARTRAAASDVLPFKPTERTLANGLKVIVVPDGFSESRQLEIPVQTGSRNEVEPGKSGFAHFFEHLMFRGTPTSARQSTSADHHARPARATTPTPATTTPTTTSTFAKEDLETILRALCRPLPEPRRTAKSDFKTEARAVLGEYNKNSAEPDPKLLEVQREPLTTTHTYKHTTMGFINDIEDMPNQYAYSKVFFQPLVPARVHHAHRCRRRRAGPGHRAGREILGRLETGTCNAPDIPRSRRRPARSTCTCRGPTDTLPYVTVAFPSPPFAETSKDSAAMDSDAALYFGQTSELYKRLVVKEQKVDQLFDRRAVERRCVAVHGLRPCEERRRTRSTCATRSWPTVASARTAEVPAKRLAMPSRSAATASRAPSTTPSASPRSSPRTRHYKRSFDTVNNYTARWTHCSRPADLQAAARRYFTDEGLIVTTLSKGTAARRHPAKRRHSRAIEPAAAFTASSSTPTPERFDATSDVPAVPAVSRSRCCRN